MKSVVNKKLFTSKIEKLFHVLNENNVKYSMNIKQELQQVFPGFGDTDEEEYTFYGLNGYLKIPNSSLSVEYNNFIFMPSCISIEFEEYNNTLKYLITLTIDEKDNKVYTKIKQNTFNKNEICFIHYTKIFYIINAKFKQEINKNKFLFISNNIKIKKNNLIQG